MQNDYFILAIVPHRHTSHSKFDVNAEYISPMWSLLVLLPALILVIAFFFRRCNFKRGVFVPASPVFMNRKPSEIISKGKALVIRYNKILFFIEITKALGGILGIGALCVFAIVYSLENNETLITTTKTTLLSIVKLWMITMVCMYVWQYVLVFFTFNFRNLTCRTYTNQIYRCNSRSDFLRKFSIFILIGLLGMIGIMLVIGILSGVHKFI